MMLPLRRTLQLAALVLALGGSLAAAPTDENQVIVPGGTNAKPPAPTPGATGTGAITLVAVLVLAGAGAWLLWRGRGKSLPNFGRGVKQLAIEETRSLGARQYLVVASYQDRKFLLGVCPGRIDLLAPLEPPGAAPLPGHPPRSS